MTVVIRKHVQEDETMASSKEKKIPSILLFLWLLAEDTAFGLGCVFDIGPSPGSPKNVHRRSMGWKFPLRGVFHPVLFAEEILKIARHHVQFSITDGYDQGLFACQPPGKP